MKLSASIVLASLLVSCGGSQPAPTGSNSASNPPASSGMGHEQHSAIPPMLSAETNVTPTVVTSAAPGGSAVDSTAVSAKSDATAAAGSAGGAAVTAGSKGTISVKVIATPASAAKNAVVYLENAPKDRDVTGTMDNRQMAFIPYVLVVTAGAKVAFTNSDPFPHNVFSPDHEKWDMGMIPAHGTRLRKFEKPGVYTALCNVHPNMKAFIVVVPSSHFAKSDKNGDVAVKDVPAGAYKMVTWAPGVKTVEQDVTVDGDKSLSVELRR